MVFLSSIIAASTIVAIRQLHRLPKTTIRSTSHGPAIVKEKFITEPFMFINSGSVAVPIGGAMTKKVQIEILNTHEKMIIEKHRYDGAMGEVADLHECGGNFCDKEFTKEESFVFPMIMIAVVGAVAAVWVW